MERIRYKLQQKNKENLYPIAGGLDVAEIARGCQGFSGADLGALVKDAATNALKARF